MSTKMEVLFRSFRKERLIYLCYVRWLFLLFPIVNGSSFLGQTLGIQLVDGRNGRPLVGTSSYVNVWVGTKRK